MQRKCILAFVYWMLTKPNMLTYSYFKNAIHVNDLLSSSNSELSQNNNESELLFLVFFKVPTYWGGDPVKKSRVFIRETATFHHQSLLNGAHWFWPMSFYLLW